MRPMNRIKPTELVSILFFLACSEPTLMMIHAGTIRGAQATAWLAAFAAFGALLIVDIAMRITEERNRAAGVAIFVGLVLSAFAMVMLSHGLAKYAAAATLIVTAHRLPRIASDRGTWLTVGVIALILVVILLWQDSVGAAVGSGSAVAAGLVFAVTFSRQSLRERAARTALAIANAELRASRELLAENSRAAERLRISRDLHDTLGHHLAALSIQLDVASRRAPEPVAQDIHEAHAITRLLLSDVRDVVGTLRRDTDTDAVALIRPMCRNIGDLAIHLEVPEGALPVDAAQAEALVRCVQEVITNTLKHAKAGNLWIQLAAVDGGIAIRARDDGRGAAQLRDGTGLTGMRERFAQLGGEVDVTTTAGNGFVVRAFMPASRAPA